MHVFTFYQAIIQCPLLRGTFSSKCTSSAQKNVHYNICPLLKCPLYRGFSMRVWPWFGRFLKKVSAVTRCLLYSISAIDRSDCRFFRVKKSSFRYKSAMTFIFKQMNVYPWINKTVKIFLESFNSFLRFLPKIFLFTQNLRVSFHIFFLIWLY